MAFVVDEKPSLNKYRSYIVIGLCCMFFLAGLPMTTNGGILLFTVFDKRCTSSLLFLCLLEIIHVAWFYGTGKFFDNLAEMNMEFNSGLRLIWTFAWRFLTPVVLAFITVYAWVDHTPMAYDTYEFPDSIEALGWVMELMPFLIVLLYPLIPLKKAYDDGLRGKELLHEIFTPTEKWYSAQMDRRQAELQAIEDAKFYHHNLGYDHEEYMQGSMQLQSLAFKEPKPVEEIEPVLQEKPKPPPYEKAKEVEEPTEDIFKYVSDVRDLDEQVVGQEEKVEAEEPSKDIFNYVSDVRDLDEVQGEEKVEVEVHSESSAEQEVIEHFDATLNSAIEDEVKEPEGHDEVDEDEVQSKPGDVIYDVIEDDEQSEPGNPPVKIIIDEAPDTREASMIVHDPIDRDSLPDDEVNDVKEVVELEIKKDEDVVEVTEEVKEAVEEKADEEEVTEAAEVRETVEIPKADAVKDAEEIKEVEEAKEIKKPEDDKVSVNNDFKAKLSKSLQNTLPPNYFTEPDIIIEENN